MGGRLNLDCETVGCCVVVKGGIRFEYVGGRWYSVLGLYLEFKLGYGTLVDCVRVRVA